MNINKTQAHRNHIAAEAAHERFYNGQKCPTCKTHKKYTKSQRCAKCQVAFRKLRYQQSEKAKSVQKSREEEWAAIIEQHKAKPQLSCQRW